VQSAELVMFVDELGGGGRGTRLRTPSWTMSKAVTQSHQSCAG